MTAPGARVHRWASRLLPARVVALLIAPAVADMQWEAEAAAGRGVAARYAALLRGYLSLLRLAPMALFYTGCHAIRVLLAEDGPTVWRVATSSACAISVCTLLLLVPSYPPPPNVPAELAPILALLLIPQALAVALPLGFLIGTLVALRHHLSHQLRTLRWLLTAAATVALLTLGTINWIVPRANQQYRELLTWSLVTNGIERSAIHLDRGVNERSLGELYDAQTMPSASSSDHALRYALHARLALIVSPLAFALLAFGVVSLGGKRWLAITATITLVAGVIDVIWYDGSTNEWPPLLRAYAPLLIFAAWGSLLAWCSARWPASEQPLPNSRR